MLGNRQSDGECKRSECKNSACALRCGGAVVLWKTNLSLRFGLRLSGAAVGAVAMVAAHARGLLATDVDTEVLPEQLDCPSELVTPPAPVACTTEPEGWEVIQEPAERELAVSPVPDRVQQVRMP